MGSKPAPMPHPPEHDLIVEYVAKAFGELPHVDYFGDREEQLKVGILTCPARPTDDLTSYSTLGLSDHPMPWGEGEFSTRIELAGVCASDEPKFANVLALAAFCIIRSGKVYHPGTVMPDYVRLIFPSLDLPHLYLTAPFLWQETLRTLDLVTRKVSWLLAMPISESERLYLTQHGEDAFESALEQAEIDFADLRRPSIA
jgi:antitoxin YqcF